MIQIWLPQYQANIESYIHLCFDHRFSSSEATEKNFEEALRYAVEWGWKRLRTVLASIVYEYYSKKSVALLLPSIIWIEMIHAYTLVHDDLPCMDNDDLRRGKPTVWRKYGETMAILVGDALQTLGFELLSNLGDIRVIQEITRAMGDLWVVRGQVRDTMMRHDSLSLEELLRIHDEKTGVFIAASLLIGAYAWGASDDVIPRLRDFWLLLGRSFQIRDDILDVEWNGEEVGKKVGKDIDAGKGIVSLIGLDASKKLLNQYEEQMMVFASELGDSKFIDIVRFVIRREK